MLETHIALVHNRKNACIADPKVNAVDTLDEFKTLHPSWFPTLPPPNQRSFATYAVYPFRKANGRSCCLPSLPVNSSVHCHTTQCNIFQTHFSSLPSANRRNLRRSVFGDADECIHAREGCDVPPIVPATHISPHIVPRDRI